MKRCSQIIFILIVIITALTISGCSCSCHQSIPSTEPPLTDNVTLKPEATSPPSKPKATCTPSDKMPGEDVLIGGVWNDCMPTNVPALEQGLIANTFSMKSEDITTVQRVALNNVKQVTLNNFFEDMQTNGWTLDDAENAEKDFISLLEDITGGVLDDAKVAGGLPTDAVSIIYSNSLGSNVHVAYGKANDDTGTLNAVLTHVNGQK